MTVPGIDAGLLAERPPSPGQDLAPVQDWPLRSYLELRALPASARSARLHVRTRLHEWRLGGLTDTAELLVSEMITNAVRAAAPHAQRTRLWLTSDGHRVLLQVWDADPGQPVRQDVGPDAEAGRGLLLIEALSAQWGFYRPDRQDAPDGPDGKIVWALCAP